jgi:hypothetical protein
MAYTPPQQQMQQAPIYSILPYYTGGFVYNPPTTPTPAATPSPASASTAAGPSANLQALLAAIPIAVDGQVIAADFHNSLRAALITLAGEMGLGLTAPTTTFTFMPAFLQSGSAPNWTSTNFVATAAAGTNPDGWLPVQLPDGQRIQSLTATGKRSGAAPTSFQVKLLRQPTTGPGSDAPTVLITVALESSTGSFSVSGSVIAAAAPAGAALSLITQAAAEEQKLIDTTNYKYFVQATVTGAAKDTVNEIDAIQITVSQ